MNVSNTRLLSEFAAGLRYDDVPGDVIESTKAVLLDCIGCAVGGGETVPARAMLDAFRGVEATGKCTIIGQRDGINALEAAYMNAFLVDILDFEETTNVSHPSASVIPAALALAEQLGSSGREFIASVVVGFEVGCRVAGACIPSPERLSQVATLFYAETLGAAAACGRLLNLTASQFESLLGIAAAHTPLPLWVSRWAKPRHWTKNNWGQQAASGLWASLLAQGGFLGPLGVLDSEIGFWRMIGSDRFDPDALVHDLGTQFHLSTVGFKWFPCCMWLQPALHAAQQILRDVEIDVAQITLVAVKTSGHVVRNFADYSPGNIVDAEFSLPFTMAALLKGIEPGPAWFSPAVMSDPDVKDMMARVTLEVDDFADAQFNNQEGWVATVEIVTDSGHKHARSYIHSTRQRYDVDWGRLEAKFRSLSAHRLAVAACDSIIETALDMERVENVAYLARLTV